MLPDDEWPARHAAPGASGTRTEVDHGLPEIPDETVDRVERSVFARIGEERSRSGLRRRAWLGAGAAAAVVVIAAAIAPGLQAGLNGGDSSPGVAIAPAEDRATSDADDAGGIADGTESAGASVDPGTVAAPDLNREIITTASATVVVDDVRDAADEVADLATSADGWVDSLSLGSLDRPLPVEPDRTTSDAETATYGSITVRVPSADLDRTVAALAEIGEVTGVDIHRQDVTEIAIDTRARIDALEASVARLTELMAQTGSVGDLIDAETALSERQAELESYRQQLQQLEGQVAMSTLTVSLTQRSVAVEADPAGFGDGILAGWNAVVATVNGIVIALGFLLPWITVAAVGALLIWAVVRLVRARRRRRSRPGPPDADGGESQA